MRLVAFHFSPRPYHTLGASCFWRGRFGKRFITANKMSPDGVVQMSIVYAYYALYGNVVSAYEPVLTKVTKLRTPGKVNVAMEVFFPAFCR